MRRPAVPVLLAALLGLSIVACGSSGRDLRLPEEGAVSPTRAVSTTVVPTSFGGTTLSPLTLTSTAFANGEAIPADFSCKGPSPSLQWSGVPAGTKELAIVVVDESDGGFVHWLLTGIAPTSGAVAKGQVPPGAVQHANSAGGLGWYGPCPTGSLPHTYTFTLMALASASAVSPSTPAKDAVAALQEQARTTGGSEAVLTGTFGGDTGGTSPGSGVAPTLGGTGATSTTRR
jgi:phosphatidylethanolamine-binding protein (PEBP) family uncharacterized protein